MTKKQQATRLIKCELSRKTEIVFMWSFFIYNFKKFIFTHAVQELRIYSET